MIFMDSGQDCNSDAGRRNTRHKNGSLCHLKVFKTLHEAPEEVDVSDPTPDYVHHLRSVLGHETAEYFLKPPPMDFQVSASLQQILDGMEDTLGAEQLWSILQEKSNQRLKEEYGDLTGQDTVNMVNLLRDFAQRPTMQAVNRKRRNLIYIRQILAAQQSLTNIQLSHNPLPDVGNIQGLEGPTRYFPQSRDCNLDHESSDR